MFRRSRFRDVVRTQLDLFERDEAALIARLPALREDYDRAERDGAEEAFGEYMDAHALLAEILGDMRDAYARTLEDPDDYVAEFNRQVRRRLPVTAKELD
jgi:hypothetical protein